MSYVNEDDSQICEDFITFLECESGVSGQAIADMMVSFLKAHGLNPASLCGQTYDGAGNMSGKTNGAAALITSQYPLALFVRCASHRLNLAVVKSLEEVYIRNMIGVVNRVYLFFSAHPKCQKNLEETIAKYQPDSSIHKLKDLCPTHWIEQIDVFNRFCLLHSSLVACMESIAFEGASKWSADSLTDASTLLLAITTTEFLSALVIVTESLRYLLGLTQSLQAESKDIVQAMCEVNTLKDTLKDLRANVDVNHSKWFSEVKLMCKKVGTVPSLPRLCGRQCHKPNIPAQSPSDYYCCTITIPLLDHLISEIENHFSKQHLKVLQGFYLIPAVLKNKTMEEISPIICEFGDIYQTDLPYPSSLESEFHRWYIKWKEYEKSHGPSSLPTMLSHTVPHASSLFPNIRILLLILCTLQVTSCSSERSFSGLKRIKTNLRSTMSDDRLSSLSLLHLHRDIDINVSYIVDEFARPHPRRLKLSNIFTF